MAPVVLESDRKRCLTAGLWSLMGPWADSLEPANRASTFNAKAETLADRPAYRNAFLKRRCIVPAEAFYEWVASGAGSRNAGGRPHPGGMSGSPSPEAKLGRQAAGLQT